MGFELAPGFPLGPTAAVGMFFEHHSHRHASPGGTSQGLDDGGFGEQIDREIDGTGGRVDLTKDRIHTVIRLDVETDQFERWVREG